MHGTNELVNVRSKYVFCRNKRVEAADQDRAFSKASAGSVCQQSVKRPIEFCCNFCYNN